MIDYQILGSRRVRKVEVFLCAPVWTDQARFDELNKVSAAIGVDVVLSGFHELRKRAIAMKAPDARSITSRDGIISAILLHEERRAEYTAKPDPLRADVFGGHV